MLELMHLQILDALERTGALTKAAEELCLTQSALTHSIRKLESVFGIRVWKKEGRNLSLTREGTYLLDSARRLLPQFRKLEENLKAFSEGRMGTLRIGVECHPCYDWLVGIIDRFLDRWKDVDIDVTRNFQFDGLTALENHLIDLMITPDLVRRESLAYVGIHDFELKLALPRSHRLAGKPFAEPADLSDDVLFCYPVPRDKLDVYTQFFIPAGARPKQHVPIETVEIMLQLVCAGRGVTTFPDWLIDRYSKDFPLAGLRLGPSGITKTLYMVIREADREIPYIRDFFSLSQEAEAR